MSSCGRQHAGYSRWQSTTEALVKFAEHIKQNKEDYVQLMEQTNALLNVIIILHIKSDTGCELPPAQQNQTKIRQFFRQSEMSSLLKDCKAGLEHGLQAFEVQALNLMTDAKEMQQYAENRHQEVLEMITALSGSDQISFLELNFLAPIRAKNIPRAGVGTLRGTRAFCSRDTQNSGFGGGRNGKDQFGLRMPAARSPTPAIQYKQLVASSLTKYPMQFTTLLLPIVCAALSQLSQAAPTPQRQDAHPTPDWGWNYRIHGPPPFNTSGFPKPGLSLVSSVVAAGDFQGNNLDTEANVLCTWTNGTTTLNITPEVADVFGAIILQL
ncbi:hypothetical protein DFH08DRAFT_826739 [Mycena albidolilacea]|uniref:Uncharacterized protein n=1 Tax=Mycena albidolilacea TaxID=1033008 RepID=A0AAD6YZH1_9AGAR|nr:hypothetical protein DFH08DRAFT_826739 [Mycena albidolilacea]